MCGQFKSKMKKGKKKGKRKKSYVTVNLNFQAADTRVRVLSHCSM